MEQCQHSAADRVGQIRPRLDDAGLKKVSIERRHFEAALKKIQPQTGDPSVYARMPSPRFPKSPEIS